SDNRPSLGVALKHETVLVKCQAGCETTDVMAALGLSMKYLAHGDDIESTVEAIYPYTDEDGELLFEVVRLHPKEFKHRRPRPDGRKGHVWNSAGARRVLYRLP